MFKKLLLTTILASASTLIIPQTDAHAQRPGKQAVQEHRQKTQQKHQETKENREEHKETIGKKLGDHIPESPETE